MDTETSNFQATETAPIKCELYVYSVSRHISQLYTGFSLLAQTGHIQLRQECADWSFGGVSQAKIAPHGVFAVLNRKKLLYYDMRDGNELNNDALKVVDAYFKRSYLDSALPGVYKSQIYPLGFYYELYPDGFDRYELQRIIARYNHPRALVRGLGFVFRRVAHAGSRFIPTVGTMCSKPSPNQQPRVLFSAAAWDPGELPIHAKCARDERISINIMRARCMQLLKKEFGNLFYGGFVHTKYALDHFRDVVLPDKRTSGKQTYTGLVRQYPICVATTGLHGSIGAKMGEYIAFSRAIVSERLNYSVPGGFNRGKNYLEFTTPEECVDQAVRLFNDGQLRAQMMRDNWHYYESFLRPDRLIWRTLTMESI